MTLLLAHGESCLDGSLQEGWVYLQQPHLLLGENEKVDRVQFFETSVLPRSRTLRKFCVSTANSIGGSRNTSWQKLFTINDTASSAESPRRRQ